MTSRTTCLASLLPPIALALAAPAAAQDAERAFLIVDPTNAESMYVANHYRAARDLPGRNLLYMDPGAADYPELAAVQLPAFLGTLASRGLDPEVDFVLLPPGDDFLVSAPGLVSDGCFAVTRFALPSAYALARQREAILAGALDVNSPNHFTRKLWTGKAFRGDVGWFQGQESDGPAAERYFIGGQLGWTGQNGNTLAEVLATIDRSVAVDEAQPVGTVYYMQTNDSARSSPRHDLYPEAVTQMLSAGGQAQHLFANLPLGNHDCTGVMTGLANPAISDPNFSLLDGSFADHLTSYAGTFWNNSQTKMTEWITKGASGTAGTVEEPCNYPGKFPNARMHVYYFKGVTLGEAWFRSMGFKPFQELLLGDPLTRPWGSFPTVDVPSPPVGPVSGVVVITPVASGTAPNADIEVLTLFVDGVPVESIPDGASFTLDTAVLADGWHELRVVAVDDKLARHPGRWIGSLEVDNHGRSVGLTATTPSGDLGTLFAQTYAAAGGTVDEVVLLHNERVVAAAGGAAGGLAVYGQNLGAGEVSVQAEARFSDGVAARSAPVALSIAYAGGGGGAAPPLAADYRQAVRDDVAVVVGLPATFDDDPGTVGFTVLSHPAQATLLGGNGPWRAYQPALGATGEDVLTYQVTTAGGTATGSVTLVYSDGDPCDLASSYCVSTPNSVGPGASMGHQGSLSITANDLVLTASGAPPNQFGQFFYGQGQAQKPLANGYLCIASGFVRFPALQLDASGQASLPIDYDDPPQQAGQITAGSTWSFQFWYRDPNGGGAGSNFTDAIEATFCP